MGKDRAHRRALTHIAFQFQTAAQDECPLAHAQEAHARFAGASYALGAAAVVLDLNRQLVVECLAEHDFDRVRAAVEPNVGERFFNDAIQIKSRLRADLRGPGR